VRSSIRLALIAVLLLGAVPAYGDPVVLLFDSFDTENGAVWKYSFNEFTNWQVIGGTVDLIGGTANNNPFYQSWGEGMFVDLDGSGNPGLF